MSLPATTLINIAGFEAYQLSNPSVELVVIPELGGKIVSLRNRRSGREWMYFPTPGRELFRNRFGDDYSRSPVAGWDECLPTITACHWNGVNLPDHGEAWALPWTIDLAAWAQHQIKTSVFLPRSELRFERNMTLSGNSISVAYTVTNQGGQTKEFIWAMHPLLALEENDKLDLPAETGAVRNSEPWLHTLRFCQPEQTFAKVFVGPLQRGKVTIQNAQTADRLSFSWNVAQCDSLGIWLTRGGWHGLHHLALEPTNGSHDSLAIAAQQNRCGRLGPGERKAWQVEIEIGPLSFARPSQTASPFELETNLTAQNE